jgi:hypothetical protein
MDVKGLSSECLIKVIDSSLGVVHLKNCLSEDVQLQLYTDIQKQAVKFKTEQARNPNSNFSKIIKINGKSQAGKITPLFKKLAKEAMAKAAEGSSQVPPVCNINYITSFVYPVPDGKLTEHCDRQDGWVLIFSLGCIAKFFIKTKNIKPITIDFCSGDALIFDSGAEANVRHGINEIVPNSAPDHLPEALHNCRMMLQYRQLPVGVQQKPKNHVVFTVKEALAIHSALHSKIAAITLRKITSQISSRSDGSRYAVIHGIECSGQSVNDNSQWAKFASQGHKITWIKSPGHWGRIIDGKIGNKGTAITGFAPDYHKGAHNIHSNKKLKISEDESVKLSSTESTTEEEPDTTVLTDQGRSFILFVETSTRKKKLTLTAKNLSELMDLIRTEFEDPFTDKRMEYEDPDFGEYVTPTCFEEIPTKTKMRIV